MSVTRRGSSARLQDGSKMVDPSSRSGPFPSSGSASTWLSDASSTISYAAVGTGHRVTSEQILMIRARRAGLRARWSLAGKQREGGAQMGLLEEPPCRALDGMSRLGSRHDFQEQ